MINQRAYNAIVLIEGATHHGLGRKQYRNLDAAINIVKDIGKSLDKLQEENDQLRREIKSGN